MKEWESFLFRKHLDALHAKKDHIFKIEYTDGHKTDSYYYPKIIIFGIKGHEARFYLSNDESNVLDMLWYFAGIKTAR